MADSFTPTLNLTKPEINQSINTWGNKLNGDLDLIDQFATAAKGQLDGLENWKTAAAPFLVPAGVILMWSGALNTIPAGWALCNGTQGTPNLQDRFILGAHPGRPPGEAAGAFSQTVATAAAGQHAHSGATAGHVLTEGQMPSHQHGGGTDAQGAHIHGYAAVIQGNPGAAPTPGNVMGQAGAQTDAAGVHVHSIITDFRGGNQAHAHGIVLDGNHAHNVTVPTVPPYFALAFIMKLAAAWRGLRRKSKAGRAGVANAQRGLRRPFSRAAAEPCDRAGHAT